MTEYRILMNGDIIVKRVKIANNFIKRLKGLLFKKELNEDEGLLISPCKQVHTIGMRFSIDVVFISKYGDVIHTQSSMVPGSVSPFIKKCNQVLELKSGTIEKKGIILGSRIVIAS